ncbi:hypothetical protein CBP51_16760 [Cellvibrio mixtus]|uniref:Uncharacterized protein n=2 Tax=Cellvibrio mixtus TaxID=39650 RepID=A0A266Q4Q9_9GAMM|nr:hypothetical protein CBP51_16760 [Cellvibrio mixtus]
MAYIIEPWNGISLNLSDGPFTLSDSLSINLDFVWISFPPLPWVSPSITAEYTAPLFTAGIAGSSNLIQQIAALSTDDLRSVLWSTAGAAQQNSQIRFNVANTSDDARMSIWSLAESVAGSQVLPWNYTGTADGQHASVWGFALQSDRTGFVSGWVMNTRYRDRIATLDWFSVNLNGFIYDDSAAMLALLNNDNPLAINLDFSGVPAALESATKIRLQFGFVKPKRPSVPHDISRTITARKATPRDTTRLIPWGAGTSVWNNWNLPYPVDNGPPIPPDPIDPPARKIVYLIMNTLQVTDVATGTPLDIQGVNISVDIDSLSWKFSGTVYGQGTLDLVRPDEDGMKDIHVTINTHEWVFSIERYTSDEKFPTTKFSISGVSRTQYMAAPFAPVRSYTNSSATTAAQAANAELENTGFALAWPTAGDGDLPDWIIPAGALSYRDKTPAQVVAQIVTTAGGVMIPSMDADSWIIQPRYKTSPWNWDTVTPDAAIYIGMVRSRSARYEPAPAYDSCFVSGVSQGVSVDVQRAGSGGLNPMPDVLDDLITAAAPAISRGRNELAATGNKVVETLSVLIPEQGAAPGVLRPGQIITVTHDNPDSDYVGLVIANSISVQKAGGAEIYQSVTLERRA